MYRESRIKQRKGLHLGIDRDRPGGKRSEMVGMWVN